MWGATHSFRVSYKKKSQLSGPKTAPQCHGALPGLCFLKLLGSLFLPQNLLPGYSWRSWASLGETEQLAEPLVLSAPPTKARVGGGVAVPGGSGWQLSRPVSGGRGGMSSQFQKSEGGGPVPGPAAVCQDERILWGLGLRDLDGPDPTTAIDLQASTPPFWWAIFKEIQTGPQSTK